MNQENLQAREATPTWAKALGAIFALPILAVLLPTLLVLAVCLLPTLGAYIADRQRDKLLSVTVGLLNFCGALPALGAVWTKGQTMYAAGEVLGDVFLWLVAYGAAGIGWLIYMMMPPLVTAYYTITTKARIDELRKRQDKLIETWGPEISHSRLAGDDDEAGDELDEAAAGQGLPF
jgi:hypothetical protein